MTPSNDNKKLMRWVGISLALHIVIIVALSLLTSRKQSDKVFYTPSYKVDLVTVPEIKRAKPKKTKIKKTKASSPKKKKTAKKKTAKKKTKAKAVAKKKVKTSKKKQKVAEVDPSNAIERLRKKHAEESAIEEAGDLEL